MAKRFGGQGARRPAAGRQLRRPRNGAMPLATISPPRGPRVLLACAGLKFQFRSIPARLNHAAKLPLWARLPTRSENAYPSASIREASEEPWARGQASKARLQAW